MARQELTRLQGAIAIASFASGVGIAVACLFVVPPHGHIENSAISIVSELLVLCGAILGVKASYDTKFRRFENELQHKADKPCDEPQRHLDNARQDDILDNNS